MPAFGTHYIFLDEMKDEIFKDIDFKADIKTAGVGCQGPDIFLFHRLWPPFTIYKALNGVSSLIHREKAEKLFEGFAEYLKQCKNRDIAKSYIYSFILHYALDRNCHPYVYAFQNQLTEENKKIHWLAAHNRVEHAVDTYLLYHRKGIYPPSLFDPEETFTNEPAALDEIADMLHFVLSSYYGREVEKTEIIRAVTDTASLQKTLSDKNGGATRLAHILETPLGPVTGYFKLSASIKPRDLELADKYANIRHKQWTSPYDNITRSDSFEELFERSKDDAKELIKNFEAVCEGKMSPYDATHNISFLTGLEVTE
jgi:hypothetical protein